MKNWLRLGRNIWMIYRLSDHKKSYSVFKTDIEKSIFFYKFENVIFGKNSLTYPDVLFYCQSDERLYNPINETVMSLKEVDVKQNENLDIPKNNKINKENLFFFVYNVDNYYHFLYDSLPYLITFLQIRKHINIKLLMNYSDHSNKFYDFVLEFLQILDIGKEDIVLLEPGVLYENIFVSDSYTHGNQFNTNPHPEIYKFYKNISNRVSIKNFSPQKIYVSRRTWKHNKFDNIGTNYTSRRQLVNETEIVEYLENLGFIEIFTELLTTEQKISMFNSATHIVGPIGGGLSNALFSSKNCDLFSICSPGFLDINSRFLHSFDQVNTHLFDNTFHVEKTNFKKYMRVLYKNIVGEIAHVSDNKLTINYTDKIVSGWSNSASFKSITVDSGQCKKLDNGLNSAWKVDFDSFKQFIEARI